MYGRERWDALQAAEQMVLEDKRAVGREWVKIERKHIALQQKREMYVRTPLCETSSTKTK